MDKLGHLLQAEEKKSMQDEYKVQFGSKMEGSSTGLFYSTFIEKHTELVLE